MQPRELSDDYTVSGQITEEDVREVARRGFRSLMCNRPDGEEPGQPDWAAIEAAARAEGLETAWVPVVSGAITEADVALFRETMARLPRPVFAYCRSGARCQNLWGLTR